jgi:hypothetical protein
MTYTGIGRSHQEIGNALVLFFGALIYAEGGESGETVKLQFVGSSDNFIHPMSHMRNVTVSW